MTYVSGAVPSGVTAERTETRRQTNLGIYYLILQLDTKNRTRYGQNYTFTEPKSYYSCRRPDTARKGDGRRGRFLEYLLGYESTWRGQSKQHRSKSSCHLVYVLLSSYWLPTLADAPEWVSHAMS
jgi:hypothetical protein